MMKNLNELLKSQKTLVIIINYFFSNSTMSKKILFWFGSDFTHYCLAYYLQKSLNAEFYSVVDITNKPKTFFKDQK